jgi:hypothetical protein
MGKAEWPNQRPIRPLRRLAEDPSPSGHRAASNGSVSRTSERGGSQRQGTAGHDALGNSRVLNDTLSIYFSDASLASAFVARWCVVAKLETAGGVFRVREDQPELRVGAGLHRTP